MQHFGMRSSSASASANSYIGSPLHDLNAVDPRPADIADVDRRGGDGVAGDSLDDDDEDSNAVVSVRVLSKCALLLFACSENFWEKLNLIGD